MADYIDNVRFMADNTTVKSVPIHDTGARNMISTAQEDIIKNDNAIKGKTSDFLYGKKILVIGDSISDDSQGRVTWVARMKEEYGDGVAVTNISKSGATIAGTSDSSFNTMYDNAELGTFDIVIIEGGINDYQQQVGLGVPINPSESSTTYTSQALVTLVNKIKSNQTTNPIIYFVCPMRSKYELTYKVTSIVDVYRTVYYYVCNILGVQFIDAYSEEPNASIYTDFMQKWTDGIHPTSAYSIYLWQYIKSRLLGFGGNYISKTKNTIIYTTSSGITITVLYTCGEEKYTMKLSGGNIPLTEGVGVQIKVMPRPFRPIRGYCTGAGWHNNKPLLASVGTDGAVVIMPTETSTASLFLSMEVDCCISPDKYYD